MRDTLVYKAKQRLEHLIFANLLQEPLRGNVNVNIAHGLDRDYVVLISQVRRYLYGNLKEEQLRNYLSRAVPNIHYRGFMSFFPMVDDDDLLKDLDRWLASKIYLALRRRSKLLKNLGINPSPPPHGLAVRQLVNLKSNGRDWSIPSFLRMNKLLRAAARTHGANAVANARAAYYFG